MLKLCASPVAREFILRDRAGAKIDAVNVNCTHPTAAVRRRNPSTPGLESCYEEELYFQQILSEMIANGFLGGISAVLHHFFVQLS